MVRIGIWNMQGANVEKWQSMIRSYMSDTRVDAMCLQECGAPPASAVALPAVMPISNPGPVPAAVVNPRRWVVGSNGASLYILTYNFGVSPGSRCNLTIVCRQPPLHWWLVWAAYGPVWRPVVGATLYGNSAVFSVHAISPNGPDALAVVAAIASLTTSVPAAQRPAAWYLGGDFNCEPTSWNGQAHISSSDGPTYSTVAPSKYYDYVISSNPLNVGVTGVRQNPSASLSDHFLVDYTGLM